MAAAGQPEPSVSQRHSHGKGATNALALTRLFPPRGKMETFKPSKQDGEGAPPERERELTASRELSEPHPPPFPSTKLIEDHSLSKTPEQQSNRRQWQMGTKRHFSQNQRQETAPCLALSAKVKDGAFLPGGRGGCRHQLAHPGLRL